MGFVLEGYFIGAEEREFTNADGTKSRKRSVIVAAESLAYRVYMSDDPDPDLLSDLKPGDVVSLAIRCYVGKNGKLSLVDGKFI